MMLRLDSCHPQADLKTAPYSTLPSSPLPYLFFPLPTFRHRSLPHPPYLTSSLPLLFPTSSSHSLPLVIVPYRTLLTSPLHYPFFPLPRRGQSCGCLPAAALARLPSCAQAAHPPLVLHLMNRCYSESAAGERRRETARRHQAPWGALFGRGRACMVRASGGAVREVGRWSVGEFESSPQETEACLCRTKTSQGSQRMGRA